MRNLKKDVWPYQIKVKIPNTQSVKELHAPDEWCKKSIGLRFRDWYSYNLSKTEQTRVFAFRDEATLLVFKLVWGQYGTK